MPTHRPPQTNHNRTAPWERFFARVLSPLEQFIEQQSTSSFLLLACTLLALGLANSSVSDAFLQWLHTPIAISVGTARFELGLQHWINEALMSFFFLLVGLELKRELLMGELANKQRAALPVIAAIGGMMVPAIIYWLWNPTGAAAAGWGIPMATDIAFAIGVLSALSKRISPALATFLIALAIVDDIGAVLVIAVFYTEQLHSEALLIAALLTVILVILNLGGIHRITPYLLIGALLWCAMFNSGIHATLSGIILAFAIPARPKNNLQPAPGSLLERHLHFLVAFLIVPLFALTNAAIPIHWHTLTETLAHPVTLGVFSGLLIGKWIGVTGASWIAIKLGIAALPTGLHMRHLHGIGLLAGIGFTMSIFVADLAFSTQPDTLLMAKTGILLASLTAALFGYCWLRFACYHSKINP